MSGRDADPTALAEQDGTDHAERATLGATLLASTALHDVLDEEVAPDDFLRPAHALIFAAVLSVVERSEPVDPITVSDELARVGDLAKAGGAGYLHALTSDVVTASNASYYAAMVRDRGMRRRLTEAGVRIAQLGRAVHGSTADAIDAARAALERATAPERADVHPVGSTVDGVIASLGRKPDYHPTPWRTLDRLIGGFNPGSLYVIGARPGEGKTIMGLQCAARLAHEGLVAFISLEMGESELQLRLIAQYGEVHMRALRNRDLDDEQWARVRLARERYEKAPIYIYDEGSTLADIRAFIRAVGQRGRLSGVVIDYLQIMSGSGLENRQAEVAEFSRTLKQLARQLSVPIIALSQLSRPPQQRDGKQPVLTDLRESGAIEQDADVVLLLNHDRERRPDELRVTVAKNRHGETGSISLVWQGQYARLQERAWDPFGPARGAT
ncbi:MULTISPECIES: replicative DNA helicase [Clavibacter]|uniref:DNA 5'-3' helicase n=1 Tax=Clavibacter seminis TaxID=2860285 RepID=A0ABY3T6F5_9MICO|nr:MULTISPECIES: replicative DNA helicase [Clavibacter]KDP90859.1 DNA helicase [Clavibacter cf. michiganensis LMG 26808]UKF24630.1 replicative DNA helicase [Clavibacter sp. A6099]